MKVCICLSIYASFPSASAVTPREVMNGSNFVAKNGVPKLVHTETAIWLHVLPV